MQAMVLEAPGRPLVLADRPDPAPGPGQLLLDVVACGVCRTDLHLLDGEVDVPRLPIVLGHQIVGRVRSGPGRGDAPATRVGVPWLGWTCGSCRFCTSGRENLCVRARFTGRDIDGGYAERAVADVRYCLRLPDGLGDIGRRAAAVRRADRLPRAALAGDAERLGLYGFGAAAHLIAQVAVWQGRRVFAFTRAGRRGGRRRSRARSAPSGRAASGDAPPEPLDAALIFAPVGDLVLDALRACDRGGDGRLRGHPHERHAVVPVRRPVAGAQHPLGGQPHAPRRRGVPARAPSVPVRSQVTSYPLADANEALDDLRHGRFEGAAVLKIGLETRRDDGRRSLTSSAPAAASACRSRRAAWCRSAARG